MCLVAVWMSESSEIYAVSLYQVLLSKTIEGKSPLHGSIGEAGVTNSSCYWPVLCTSDFCVVEDALGQV